MEIDIGETKAFRENREEPDVFVGRGDLRFQRSLGRIQNNPGRANLRALEHFGGAAHREIPQAVIRPDVIDVD